MQCVCKVKTVRKQRKGFNDRPFVLDLYIPQPKQHAEWPAGFERPEICRTRARPIPSQAEPFLQSRLAHGQ
jgi:hypothetical protein